MDYFETIGDQIHCEDVSLQTLAEEFGTPLYIYSNKTLLRHLDNFLEAFSSYPTTPCFAVKANSNKSLLNIIFNQGFGADIVSGGELLRSLDAKTIVYSGVGKTDEELKLAVKHNVTCFNVESLFELERIAALFSEDVHVSLRINPNIDAKTHPKISTGMTSTKFGILETGVDAFKKIIDQNKHIKLVGLGCHIGSQLTDLTPLREAAQRMTQIALSLKEHYPIEWINMGGGLGIRYGKETPPSLKEYATCLIDAIKPSGLKLLVEPGRVLVGNTGVLITKTLGIKDNGVKKFLVVDAAMNDLMRPAIYDSYHEIEPVKKDFKQGVECFDVVGPICESTDVFAKDRNLPNLSRNDLVMIRGVGAYGMSLSNQYNSRCRPAEVLVDGKNYRLIRKREQFEDLISHDC